MSCLSFCFRPNPQYTNSRPQPRRVFSPVLIHGTSTPPVQVLERGGLNERRRDLSISSVPSRCQSLHTVKAQSIGLEGCGKGKEKAVNGSDRPGLQRGGSCQSALRMGGSAKLPLAAGGMAGRKVQRPVENGEDVELTSSSSSSGVSGGGRFGMVRSLSGSGGSGQGAAKPSSLPTIPARQQLQQQQLCACCGISGGSCSVPAVSSVNTPAACSFDCLHHSPTYGAFYPLGWDSATSMHLATSRLQNQQTPPSSAPSTPMDQTTISPFHQTHILEGIPGLPVGTISTTTTPCCLPSEYFGPNVTATTTTTATATLTPGTTTKMLFLPASGSNGGVNGSGGGGLGESYQGMGYGYTPQPVQVQVTYDKDMHATITASTTTANSSPNLGVHAHFANTDLPTPGGSGPLCSGMGKLQMPMDSGISDIQRDCCSLSSSPASTVVAKVAKVAKVVVDARPAVGMGAEVRVGFNEYFDGPSGSEQSHNIPTAITRGFGTGNITNPTELGTSSALKSSTASLLPQAAPKHHHHNHNYHHHHNHHNLLGCTPPVSSSLVDHITPPPLRCPSLTPVCEHIPEPSTTPSPNTLPSRDPSPPPPRQQPQKQTCTYQTHLQNPHQAQQLTFFHDGHGGGTYAPTTIPDPCPPQPPLPHTTATTTSTGNTTTTTPPLPPKHETTSEKREKRVQKVGEACRIALKRAVSADNTKAARAAAAAAATNKTLVEEGRDKDRDRDRDRDWGWGWGLGGGRKWEDGVGSKGEGEGLEDGISTVDSWEEEERKGEVEEEVRRAERVRLREEKKIRVAREKARAVKKVGCDVGKGDRDGDGDGGGSRRVSEETVEGDGEGHCTLDCDGESCHN